MIRFAAVVAVLAVASATSRGEYIMNVTQVGANVVASGSGTIDLTGLSFSFSPPGGGSPYSDMNPSQALLEIGTNLAVDLYTGSSGPSAFGPGGLSYGTTESGDTTGIGGAFSILVVPQGYVSGAPLSGTATWDNETFSSLGLTPGTYTYTWGSGPSDDSLVVNIGPTAVPEPSSLTLLGTAIGYVGIGVGLRRRRLVPAVA